jgi:hypothetical protein
MKLGHYYPEVTGREMTQPVTDTPADWISFVRADLMLFAAAKPSGGQVTGCSFRLHHLKSVNELMLRCRE